MARKIENEEMEKVSPAVPAPQETPDNLPTKGGKRKVVVINVPKRKKLLYTPTRIIRILLLWALIFVLLLLSYPFLEVRFYITKDLTATPKLSEAYDVLATQEDIDKAEAELRTALEGLVEAPKEEEESTGESSAQDSQETSTESTSEESSTAAAAKSGFLEMNTLDYNWMYTIQEGVNEEKLTTLIDEVKKIKRSLYTQESLDRLNVAVLKAQKILCASVFVSQNALQMMLGGTIGEAFGGNISLSNTFLRAILTFALGVLPMIAFLACLLDKRRMIKNIIVMICSALALADIFLTIYPYVGIGAVLTIIMYVLIMLLNIGGFYAGQQEKYIVNHPELEAEYTQKHPHFVKALINHKSIYGSSVPTRAEQERTAAINAKKRQTKKKKGR